LSLTFEKFDIFVPVFQESRDKYVTIGTNVSFIFKM
jgi:hypothetical protein